MHKVDILQLRKEVVAIINANKKKVTSFEHKKDFSIFTFCGENYVCEINLSDKWFGYDLMIETPDGNMRCDYEAYNDGPDSEKVILKIYDDLIELVEAIFDRRVNYSSTRNDSYVVVENSKGKYNVVYNQKKKRFLISHTSGWWKNEIDKSEFEKLNIRSLEVLS